MYVYEIDWFTCDQCGEQISFERRRQTFSYELHHYCSVACRQMAYRQKRTQERGTRDCRTCGDTFTPKRSDSKYCSSKCRQKAYRERKA